MSNISNNLNLKDIKKPRTRKSIGENLNEKGFFQYGIVIPDLVLNGKIANYPVVNETAVRVQAGMMTLLASFALTSSQLAQYYVPIQLVSLLFFIDFFAKVIIGLRFSPFYTISSYFVRKKQAEYVGAVQKRFAWSIGLGLATLMVYLQFIMQIRGGITTFICALCVIFMGLEWLFGLCVGCRLYYGLIALGVIKKPDVLPACPNGVCPIGGSESGKKVNRKQRKDIPKLKN